MEKLNILHVLTACSATFSNRFLYDIISLSHHCRGRFLTTLLQFIEVCGYFSVHSSLKVPPQNFSQVEVWILTGPLQHLNSFLFPTFCWRFAAVFGIIVVQPNFSQALSVGQMASHLTQRILWYTEELTVNLSALFK